MCLAPFPRCPLCASPHLTNTHKSQSSPGGHKCTHQFIKCVNYPNSVGHKAFDPVCPARANTQLLAKTKVAR